MARSPSPPPDLEELGRLLVARVDGTLRDVDRVVDGPRASADTLHLLHRDLRRLRVGLEVWRCASPTGRQPQLRDYDRRLKRLARLIGGVRDRDVALSIVTRAPATLPVEERGELRELRSHLVEEARAGRELVRASLRTERDCGLFEGVRRAFTTLPSRRRASALGKYLLQVRSEGQSAVRAAHRKARREPSSRRLHRLRIRVRSWRHLTDLAAAIDPAYVPPEAKPLRTLQARLGRLHDLDVVEDLTAEGAPDTLVRAIRRARHRQRAKVVRQLRGEHWHEIVPAESATA